MENDKEYYALMGSNRGIIDWYSFVMKIYNEGNCVFKDMNEKKLPFVLITKEEIEKVPGVKESILYKDVLNDKNHKCDICGCRSNYFMQDFRNVSEMTSKYYSCEFCYPLNDIQFFKLLRKEGNILDFL